MKRPKVFIGSSKERLSIALAIQENLHDCSETTIWNQGVFELTSNILNDLIAATDNFDFAIFVFHPDDKLEIRNESFRVVRDNLIFELGLFIGKLGSDKVFYLLPKSYETLHLPTDLLGINAGEYDNVRSDENLVAATAPFCNRIRSRIENHRYINLDGFEAEDRSVKKIVIEQKKDWRVKLAIAIYNRRIQEVEKRLVRLEKGLFIKRVIVMSGSEFFDWYSNSFSELRVLFIEKYKVVVDNFVSVVNESENAKDIKDSVELIFDLCDALVLWEEELSRIESSEYLMEAKSLLSGTSKFLIQFVKQIFEELQKKLEGETKEINIRVKLEVPDNLEKGFEVFKINLQNIANES
jgi:hypothetical protein